MYYNYKSYFGFVVLIKHNCSDDFLHVYIHRIRFTSCLEHLSLCLCPTAKLNFNNHLYQNVNYFNCKTIVITAVQQILNILYV